MLTGSYCRFMLIIQFSGGPRDGQHVQLGDDQGHLSYLCGKYHLRGIDSTTSAPGGPNQKPIRSVYEWRATLSYWPPVFPVPLPQCPGPV